MEKYKNAEAMPSLPVPELEGTKQLLKEWIEPLVDEAQFKKTAAAIDCFFGDSGEAHALQEKLLEWNKQTEGSWLAPLWTDMYLAYRGSLPLEMNYIMKLDTPYKNQYDAASLAGKISRLTAEYYGDLVDGILPAEQIKGKPLDMSQFPDLFKSVRIPQHNADRFETGEWTKKNNFIILSHRRQFYRVSVTDENGQLIDEQAVSRAVENILKSDSKAGQNTGIFTAASRETAAGLYNELCKYETNAASLQTIADALAVIVIDGHADDDPFTSLFSGSAGRYYDKPVEIVIAEDLTIGFNFEHTAIDGSTVVSFVCFIDEQAARGPAGDAVFQANAERLEWELPPAVKKQLEQIEAEHNEKKSAFSLRSRNFMPFGAAKMKELGMSPDAFFHTALQIAQYRVFGSFQSTYEPVSVRSFYEGRTECARAASKEKAAFAKALESPAEDRTALYTLMQEAGAAHSARLKQCQAGLGAERHLFGLQKMAEQTEGQLIPDFYEDPGYSALRSDFLSTSGLAFPGLNAWGFGPVANSGYGISYTIMPDCVGITVSNHIENNEFAERMLDHLFSAMEEMERIAEDAVAI